MEYCITMEQTRRIAVWFNADSDEAAEEKALEIYHIKRYRHALAAPEKKRICQEADAALQAAYDQLPPEDKKHPFTAQSETARDYRLTARKLLDQKYTALANLCQE